MSERSFLITSHRTACSVTSSTSANQLAGALTPGALKTVVESAISPCEPHCGKFLCVSSSLPLVFRMLSVHVYSCGCACVRLCVCAWVCACVRVCASVLLCSCVSVAARLCLCVGTVVCLCSCASVCLCRLCRLCLCKCACVGALRARKVRRACLSAHACTRGGAHMHVHMHMHVRERTCARYRQTRARMCVHALRAWLRACSHCSAHANLQIGHHTVPARMPIKNGSAISERQFYIGHAIGP